MPTDVINLTLLVSVLFHSAVNCEHYIPLLEMNMVQW